MFDFDIDRFLQVWVTRHNGDWHGAYCALKEIVPDADESWLMEKGNSLAADPEIQEQKNRFFTQSVANVGLEEQYATLPEISKENFVKRMWIKSHRADSAQERTNADSILAKYFRIDEAVQNNIVQQTAFLVPADAPIDSWEQQQQKRISKLKELPVVGD